MLCDWPPASNNPTKVEQKNVNMWYFSDFVSYLAWQETRKCRQTFLSKNLTQTLGGPREKPIKFLLRGRMIFCYHVNRFLTVCLLSEIFTQQNTNFQGENCPQKCNFWPKLPPDTQCRFLLQIKQMSQWVVSSEVLTTHKVWGKVLFDHF